MKRSCALIASLFLACVFYSPSASAACYNNTCPAEDTVARHGGPNATPIKDVVSQTDSAATTVNNLAKLDGSVQRGAGQHSALEKVANGVRKAMGLYGAHMNKKSDDDRDAIARQQKYGAPDSQYASSLFSTLIATTGVSGPQGRAVATIMRDDNTEPQELKDGCGGIHCGAYKIVQKICRSGCLEQEVAQTISKDSRFRGCTGAGPGDDRRGMATGEGADRAAPQGVQIGGGGKHEKCVQSRIAMKRFRRYVETMASLGGYGTIREALRAELKEMTDQNGRIIPSLYNQKHDPALAVIAPTQVQRDKFGNPIILAETGLDSSGTVYTGLGNRLLGSADTAEDVAGLERHASLPNPGSDNYEDLSKQYTESTGQKKPYADGRIPPATGVWQMEGGAGASRAAQASNERSSPAELGTAMQGIRQNQTMANLGQEVARGSTGGSSTSLAMSLETLQAIIDTPEFRTYLAALDEKTITDVIASVEHEFERDKYRYTYNYNQYLNQHGHKVMFAVNGERLPSNMFGALAASGVDKNTMLLNSGEFRTAGLSPLLDMRKLDVLEPTQVQLAINDLIAPPQPVVSVSADASASAVVFTGMRALPIVGSVARQ